MKEKGRLLVAVSALMVFSCGALNCSGMCVSQFRYLSDEEKIRITAITASTTGVYSSLDRRQVSGHSDATEGPIDYSKYYFRQPLPYESLDAFYKENPNCCQVVPKTEPVGDEDPPFTFWNMVMGYYNYRVRATFIQRDVITPINPDKSEGKKYIRERLVKGKTALYGNCGLPAYKYISDFN